MADTILGTGPRGVGFLDSVLGVGSIVGGMVATLAGVAGRLGTDLAAGVLLWSAPLVLVTRVALPCHLLRRDGPAGPRQPARGRQPGHDRPADLPRRGARSGLRCAGGLLHRDDGARVRSRCRSSSTGWGSASRCWSVAGARRAGRPARAAGHAPARSPAAAAGEPPPPVDASTSSPRWPQRHWKSLARGAAQRQFAAGDVLVREGEDSDLFFVIERGLVEVTQGDRVLRQRGPGRVLRRDRAAARRPADGDDHRRRGHGRAGDRPRGLPDARSPGTARPGWQPKASPPDGSRCRRYSMTACPNCSADQPDGARFCASCGVGARRPDLRIMRSPAPAGCPLLQRVRAPAQAGPGSRDAAASGLLASRDQRALR